MIGEAEVDRVHLDDLPDYFHDLGEEDVSILRNAIGRTYAPAELLAAGAVLSPAERAAATLAILLACPPDGFTPCGGL